MQELCIHVVTPSADQQTKRTKAILYTKGFHEDYNIWGSVASKRLKTPACRVHSASFGTQLVTHIAITFYPI